MAALHTLFVVATLGHLAWHARTMQLAFASRHWRSTQGTIQQCYVGENRNLLSWFNRDPDDSRDDGYHTTNIRYTYRVGTQQFVSTRLSYQPTRALMFADAVGQLQGLLAGREVEVFYDPLQPSRAVILPGPSHDNAIRMAVAVVLFAVAMWTTF